MEGISGAQGRQAVKSWLLLRAGVHATRVERCMDEAAARVEPHEWVFTVACGPQGLLVLTDRRVIAVSEDGSSSGISAQECRVGDIESVERRRVGFLQGSITIKHTGGEVELGSLPGSTQLVDRIRDEQKYRQRTSPRKRCGECGAETYRPRLEALARDHKHRALIRCTKCDWEGIEAFSYGPSTPTSRAIDDLGDNAFVTIAAVVVWCIVCFNTVQSQGWAVLPTMQVVPVVVWLVILALHQEKK